MKFFFKRLPRRRRRYVNNNNHIVVGMKKEILLSLKISARIIRTSTRALHRAETSPHENVADTGGLLTILDEYLWLCDDIVFPGSLSRDDDAIFVWPRSIWRAHALAAVSLTLAPTSLALGRSLSYSHSRRARSGYAHSHMSTTTTMIIIIIATLG